MLVSARVLGRDVNFSEGFWNFDHFIHIFISFGYTEKNHSKYIILGAVSPTSYRYSLYGAPSGHIHHGIGNASYSEILLIRPRSQLLLHRRLFHIKFLIAAERFVMG